MKQTLIFILTAVILLIPGSLFAAEILSDTEITVSDDQTYEENLYVGAGKTVIDGNTTEDLVVLGGEITANGSVEGDVFLVGGFVNFKGEVMGDLRVLGGKVIIEGLVHGDVVIVGGEVVIGENARIENEIVTVGGTVTINGPLKTELKVVAGTTKLNGSLSGTTEIMTQGLVIGDTADIEGNFSYYAPQSFIKEEGAVVSGTISFNEINSIRDTSFIKKIIVSFLSFWFLLRFITTLILAFILIYVFRVFSQGVTDLSMKSFWKSLLAGILIIIFAPLIILILFVSLVALPIGFLLIIALMFIAIIIPAIAGILIGTWSKQYLSKNSNSEIDLKGATIGVIILTILQFVPYIGNFIRAIIYIVILGAIIRQIRVAIIK